MHQHRRGESVDWFPFFSAQVSAEAGQNSVGSDGAGDSPNEPMNKLLSCLLRAVLPRRFYVSHWTQSYVAWLEGEIDRGTQFAQFEPNGEQLWNNVRRTIEDFLLNEFARGGLVGNKPEQAYWVRCDRSTMTQNDLDNGRLVCLVGVAPLRPAEFVIFRIGQWTASRKPDP